MTELHIAPASGTKTTAWSIEAFHHAAAAHDIERAERLIEGQGIPLHFRGAVTAVLDWLASLPAAVLDARPSLWWRYASLLLVTGQTTGVEEKLQAAEAALRGAEPDDRTRKPDRTESPPRGRRWRSPGTTPKPCWPSRAAPWNTCTPTTWRSARPRTGRWGTPTSSRATAPRPARPSPKPSRSARRPGTSSPPSWRRSAWATCRKPTTSSTLAAETYRRVLQLAGDQPLQIVCEAQLGLARISTNGTTWTAAEQHGRQSLHLARQYESVIDRFIICEVFLARLKLARGDVAGAAAMLAAGRASPRASRTSSTASPDVAAAQVLTLLRQGNLAAAAQLAQTHDLPAQPGPCPPGPRRRRPRRWRRWSRCASRRRRRAGQDERLKAMVLQALAHQAHGEKDEAVQVLGEALALASRAASSASLSTKVPRWLGCCPRPPSRSWRRSTRSRLLAAFGQPPGPVLEPLSQRELEVLRLMAQGLSNQEIGERLFLALDTVKGHNRKIFSKLQVHRRTEAVARARELGLL